MFRQRNCHFALGLLGCIVILLSTTTADNSVHILSKYAHQLLTSTTLKWLPIQHYDPNESKEIVIGGFENVADGEGATFLSQCVRCVYLQLYNVTLLLVSRRECYIYVCRIRSSEIIPISLNVTLISESIRNARDIWEE